jgi:hypothetical protein
MKHRNIASKSGMKAFEESGISRNVKAKAAMSYRKWRRMAKATLVQSAAGVAKQRR